MQILTVSGLQKTYTTRFGGSKVQALKNVNFTVESGEYVAIMGESGSGKTTLLNILAALDKPTGGTVLLGGKNLSEIPEETAAAFRRDNLGFVFQDFSLLDTFSLEDNILLPLAAGGTVERREEVQKRGFAAAALAHDGDVLAALDGEGDAFERLDLRAAEAGGVGLGETADFKKGHGENSFPIFLPP